jgi:hypothetical protein
MQITNVSIRNVMGARHVDLVPRTPIVLIGGDNGQGKSSIQEAVRMAFRGETFRVSLKKEYPQLVSEGAKNGTVLVETDDGKAGFVVPSGSHSIEGGIALDPNPALPFVLDPRAFMKLPADERRTFLFRLTKSEITEAKLRKLLAEAECAEDLVAETIPLLKSITGFPAAAKFAGEKSTEAKGAWRGVTGETYGSKKGEGWTAVKPEVDEAAIAAALKERDAMETHLREVQQTLADLRAQRNTYDKDSEQRVRAEELAATLPRLRAKLAVDKTTLLEMEARVGELKALAGDAPKVGLEHDFARAVEFALEALGDDPRQSIQATVKQLNEPFNAYVKKYGLPSNTSGDAEARENLPKYEALLTTARNTVQNTERAILTAEHAETRTKDEPLPFVSDIRIQEAAQHVEGVQAEYRKIDDKLVELQMAKRAADEADDKTQRAAKHHRDVAEWAKLATQFGPDGIPAQILAQALRPFNAALRSSATKTNWRQPTINADMSVTAEGRPYSLLCESEKWRVNAMIAEAISDLSGLGMLVLDRVDVLGNKARIELLVWLTGRANEGALKTALLFATLKQPAFGLPPAISCEWIREGELLDTAQIAEAFPALSDKILASSNYRKAA